MTATLDDVLDAFRARERTNSERGTRFEELMVRYFELDPVLASTYDRVLRWTDWEGRDGRPDTGIDLVARSRVDGTWTAIQCKFYEPGHRVAKADIDSFLAASSTKDFTNRVIISTSADWGPNAENAVRNQQPPVQRIGTAELAAAPIDWDVAWPDDQLRVELRPAAKHRPKPHQRQAIEKVRKGFATSDRGRLIMACGTGKTFTALKLVESMAADAAREARPGPYRVLFLVPSISLLSQTLREWTSHTGMSLAASAVCSDSKASRAAEDISTVDVVIPVTTDPGALAGSLQRQGEQAELSVVFSTYQSLAVVHEAQNRGAAPFDLIVCDEAHRTTGATLAGADESAFVQVHDPQFITAAKRLYMTATPRIFAEETREKASENAAVLTSMDDEAVYGPEFHYLGFGEAVERDLLTDYKVLVLTVDEQYVAGPLQRQLVDENNELTLDDATRIVGCWNGLAKRTGRGAGNADRLDGAPMQRAVAFLRDIRTSKRLAGTFESVIEAYEEADDDVLDCTVQHVDGTYNALERNQRLDWLKAPVAEGECRILANARCLSEGVDVPALDAVLFLNPRNSAVDVIQSVGRVMRKAEGKDHGYIILPVGVPAGVAPDRALADNKRFKVVWQVLQALRAHDDRFDATVNKLDLNRDRAAEQLLIAHVTGGDGDGDPEATAGGQEDAARRGIQTGLDLELQWRDAVYAKIVAKVGTRTYWEDWAKDVAGIAAAQRTRIRALLEAADEDTAERFAEFVQGLRDNLNESVGADDAISMLSQHLITKPVFDALFEGYDFAAHNPVSVVMERMARALEGRGLDAETERLEGFYESVRMRASDIDNAEGKQRIIAELYEKFFRTAFPAQSDALGIVYTPTEVVDFILRAADDVSREHFGRGLTDEGVHVLDPFTGTGTFLTRLLQSGIVAPHDLARKYASELHANEIMLLAYYIAAVNIEATYHGIAGGDYRPFEGIVLTDTFQMTEGGDGLDHRVFTANSERVLRQLEAPIRVIVGNPPYSVGQSSANDNNANLRYPDLDRAIEGTYAARSTATLKNSLYDSYIRAIRWATDRIGNSGVLAYVSNGGWIDGNTADGLRLSLAGEFSALYVYNLRGNQRTAGELSRREGGKIFGSGARTTVAILVAVKDPAHTGDCVIRYRDIGDYLTREQKLEIVGDDRLDTIDWQAVVPNEHGDWIGHRSDNFSTFPAIGDKKDQSGTPAVFSTYSAGVKTSRDAWCYNYSSEALTGNVRSMIDFYNAEVDRFAEAARSHEELDPLDVVDLDPRQFSWDRINKRDVTRGYRGRYSADKVRTGAYRPFNRQNLYFDPEQKFNNTTYLQPSFFPTPHHENYGIILTGPASHFEFTPFIVGALPDLHTLDTAQFFPRWTYEKVATPEGQLELEGEPGVVVDEHGYRRVDNVTDAILADHRAAYGPDVSKDDVFCYVYGLLHSPDYRAAYAADLTKMLPRIPRVASAEDFRAFAEAGRRLSELHLGYETVEPYPLTEIVADGAPEDDYKRHRVTKMRFRSKQDRSALVYNPWITLERIPEEAHEYLLGSRSGLEWVIRQYQVVTDKKSGIVNDPNDWAREHDEPRYILDLVRRVVTVSVETVRIVRSLPTLRLREKDKNCAAV